MRLPSERPVAKPRRAVRAQPRAAARRRSSGFMLRLGVMLLWPVAACLLAQLFPGPVVPQPLAPPARLNAPGPAAAEAQARRDGTGAGGFWQPPAPARVKVTVRIPAEQLEPGDRQLRQPVPPQGDADAVPPGGTGAPVGRR